MSFQMAKGFHQAWKLKMVEQKSSTMVVYFLIGWGTPFLIVAISIIVNFSIDSSHLKIWYCMVFWMMEN